MESKANRTMTELLLTSIIFASLLIHVWFIRKYFEQEKRYIKALLSKDLNDFTYSEIAEKPIKKTKEEPDDLVPLSELSDKEWNEAILNNAI